LTFLRKIQQLLAIISGNSEKRKGFLSREFDQELGIAESTLIKWEGGRLPHPKYLER
jgi:hypothetical protein